MANVLISKKLDLIVAAVRGTDLEAVEIVLTGDDLRRLAGCAGAPIGSLKAGFYRGVQVSTTPGKHSHFAVRLPDGMIAHAPLGPRAFAEWLSLPDGWPPLSPAAPAKRVAAA